MPWSKRLFTFWKLILDLTAWSAVFRPFIIYLVGKGEGRMLGKIIIFFWGKGSGTSHREEATSDPFWYSEVSKR